MDQEELDSLRNEVQELAINLKFDEAIELVEAKLVRYPNDDRLKRLRNEAKGNKNEHLFGLVKELELKHDLNGAIYLLLPEWNNRKNLYIGGTLGNLLIKAGRINDAVQVLEEAHKKYPDDRFVINLLARAYNRKSRYTEALNVLSKIKKSEKNKYYYANFAQAKMGERKRQAALPAAVPKEQQIKSEPKPQPVVKKFKVTKKGPAGRSNEELLRDYYKGDTLAFEKLKARAGKGNLGASDLLKGLYRPKALAQSNAAMATISKAIESPGGIDLTRTKEQMNISKQGAGVEMQFDPAMIERIKREGFDGLEFHIQSIVPVTDLPQLLGLDAK
jgi:tetratricopeptide (TPR) repeat protein